MKNILTNEYVKRLQKYLFEMLFCMDVKTGFFFTKDIESVEIWAWRRLTKTI